MSVLSALVDIFTLVCEVVEAIVRLALADAAQ